MMKVARVKKSRATMVSWDTENIWYSVAFGHGSRRLQKGS